MNRLPRGAPAVSASLACAALLAAALPRLADDAWDYDEGVFLQLAALWREGHPLYVVLPCNKPPLLPALLRVAFALGGPGLVVGRGALLLASLGLLVAATRTARRWFGTAAATAAPWVWLCLEQLPSRAAAVMPDLLGLGLALTTFAAVERAHRRASAASAFVAGACAALAVCAHPIVLSALPAWVVAWHWSPAPERPRAPPAALVAGALSVLVASLAPFSPRAVWRWTIAYNLAGRAHAIALTRPPGEQLVALARDHAALVALGLLGAVTPFAPRRARALAALWWASSVAALCLWRPLWPNYHVVALAPACLLAASAAQGLSGLRVPGRSRRLASLTLAAMALVLLRRARTDAPRVPWTAARVALREHLRRAVPEGVPVAADDPFVLFAAGRRPPPPLADTSFKRLRIGWLDPTSLLGWRYTLFASGRFESVDGLEDRVARTASRRWTFGEARLYESR